MLFVSDISTNPYFNLAEEEYLLKFLSDDIFRLWRNSPSIIVGRYQNTIAEIDQEYTKSHNIPVVRRLSGGGAVFHDLGNLNFTFIQNLSDITLSDNLPRSFNSEDLFRRFTAPVLEALKSLGLNAELSGRNDLTIDGLKISGNAICRHKNRILMHGTLMFDVSTSDLGKALLSRPEKFIGKAVKSNVKRITNIKEHLGKNADTIWFKNYMGEYICRTINDITPYSLSEKDIARIERIKSERYATDQWNYGKSPLYTFSNTRRFPQGIVELYLTVKDGIIAEADIKGDYFFTKPTEEFIALIKGIPHTPEQLRKKTGTLDMDAYFCGICPEDIVSLFF